VPIFGLLTPDFALIALGFALRRWARFGDEFWPGLASRMGADGPLVARILAIQLLIAAATLPLWLSLLVLRF